MIAAWRLGTFSLAFRTDGTGLVERARSIRMDLQEGLSEIRTGFCPSFTKGSTLN